MFHSHHSEYGGGPRLMPQDARRSSSGVRFYIGEAAADEDLDVGVDAAAAAAESFDSLSLFEEEVHTGLQRVLNQSIKRQVSQYTTRLSRNLLLGNVWLCRSIPCSPPTLVCRLRWSDWRRCFRP